MICKTHNSVWFALAVLVCLLALPQSAQAGPPLLCQPFEIGNAPSLPWSNPADWRAVKRDYDLNRLVDDTLALLAPGTPVLARMETLRRATVYAVWARHDGQVGYAVANQQIADELIERLLARVGELAGQRLTDPVILFDAGYLLANFRQAGWSNNHRLRVDAYAMVRKAAGLSGDGVMELGAALCAPDKAAQYFHLQKAIARATEGTPLASNLVSHFRDRGHTLAELRASVGLMQY